MAMMATFITTAMPKFSDNAKSGKLIKVQMSLQIIAPGKKLRETTGDERNR